MSYNYSQPIYNLTPSERAEVFQSSLDAAKTQQQAIAQQHLEKILSEHEFQDVHYLVTEIFMYLVEKCDSDFMAQHKIHIIDLLEGNYSVLLHEQVKTIFRNWDEKLTESLFSGYYA